MCTTKSMGLMRTALVLTCVFFMALLTVGCDDENSSESKLEAARIAIDGGQYTKAITLLDGMTGQEALEVLASAYAGRAGIDSFEILNAVDDGGANDGSIDLIGKMLGSGDDDILTGAEIDAKMDQIDLAVATLLDSVGGDPAALDEDGKVKLAIYGLTDVVLTLGKVIATKTGSDVVLTEAAIQALPDHFDVADLTAAGVSMVQLSDDLEYVYLGVLALGGESNDLAEEFIAFRAEITNGDAALSDQDLVDYINAF